MNPRRTIWIAIVFSTVIYFVLGFSMSRPPGEFERLARGQYVPIFYGMAVAMFLFGTFVVPRIIRSSEQARMIAALAVFESCAIFGLLATVFMKDWRYYLGPWALAIIGFVRELPRDETAEPRAPR
jgi:hypothetical protein